MISNNSVTSQKAGLEKVGEGKPMQRDRPRLNSRRYFWLIIGYYLVSMYVKTNAEKQNFSITNPLSEIGKIVPSDALVSISEDNEDEHHSGGIKIFKIDWGHVSGVSVITLWILCASLAKIAFHVTPKLGHIFPESCLLIVVGILIGVVVFVTEAVDVDNQLPTNTFFFFMLPPIILDAGYFMPGRLFFGNLGTILLFAVVGTVWNAFTIGFSLWGLAQYDVFGIEIGILELLLFSTLISAVDPVAVLAVFEEIHVNEILYIVVFGESLLNDAVTVVLYHMFEEYVIMGEDKVTVEEVLKGTASFPVVALGGTIIGILWGLLTGLMTRFTNHVLVIEPIFVFIMAYMSYLNAELFHMSGVLAITFCGITMKKYVEANICQNSNVTVKYAMKMLSSSSETIIFMYLGVSTVSKNHVWNWWFVIATIGFCTLFRFLGVLWMSALANRFRLNKLSMVDQFVMSYGGLRGAVSFALVLLIEKDAVPNEDIRNMFVTTTIAVVFFTVFVQGITIKPLVAWLNVKRAEEREVTMNERLHERLMDHTLSVLESILGTLGQNKLRDKVKQIDETYIRPYLIRDYNGTSQAKILETYSKLQMQDALEDMKRRGTKAATLSDGKDEDGGVGEIAKEPHKELLVEDVEAEARKISDHSRRISEMSRKISTAHKISIQSGSIDLLSNDIFKPARKQRKISYSRHTLEPQDLEPELHFQFPPRNIAAEGRPRRKMGVPNLGMDGENGAYVNPAFSVINEDERWKAIPSSVPPSRKVSMQDTPNNSAPPSPAHVNPPSRQVPARLRRHTPQPQTGSDLDYSSVHSPMTPTTFDYQLRSPPPFADTIPEETSD